jgi:CDP-glycerol glycerophosphotransferase (TagB/SpsB family)
MAQFYWDIKADTEKDGIVRAIELKNHEKWMHRIMYLQQMHYVYADGNIVYPYKTKSRNIALHFRQKTEQDCWAFIMKEYLALAIYYISRPWLKRRNIWLVYEKYCVMAQDNSFYFFKYCMEQLPESERKRIYYVIDKKASDYQYVRQYGDRVIDFLSLKHMIYLKAASLLISSDTKAHAYAWHSTNSVYRNMLKWKENVFLQHGVIAFKCCHQGLRKKSVNASSLFVVSSDVEKQIILDYFGYNEDQILVTGLARWDVLEDKSKGEPRQIILMPTWRTWLEEVSEAVFKASDYYKNYMALLNNRTLIDTLEEYQVTLNFYIHPKFREYMGTFQVESDYVKLIPFGSEPLNEMMMRCSMMITDYSSAVWDVFYQGKPVLFYLFDLEMYNEVQGSYIDMETETFGDVAHTPETLVELIREYAQNDFKEKEVYGRKRDKEIAYIDNKNSERIYREIAKRYATSLSTPEDALP